jgi:acyl-CoA hydrolase
MSREAEGARTGRTSLEVGMRVETESIRDGARRHTNSCFFTMVAVDETGAPVPVPPLVPATDRERKWFTGAIARRAALKAAFAD